MQSRQCLDILCIALQSYKGADWNVVFHIVDAFELDEVEEMKVKLSTTSSFFCFVFIIIKYILFIQQ